MGGDALGIAEDAQYVPSCHLGAVLAAPAAVEERGEQHRVARHVLEAGREGVDTVVVPPDADVIDAGDLPGMVEVLDDLSWSIKLRLAR